MTVISNQEHNVNQPLLVSQLLKNNLIVSLTNQNFSSERIAIDMLILMIIWTLEYNKTFRTKHRQKGGTRAWHDTNMCHVKNIIRNDKHRQHNYVYTKPLFLPRVDI